MWGVESGCQKRTLKVLKIFPTFSVQDSLMDMCVHKEKAPFSVWISVVKNLVIWEKQEGPARAW